MLWFILIASVVLALVGLLLWRIYKRRQHRLIAIVALLREPTTFDPAVLASVAGRAWDVDLGDGSSEGPDGFVAGNDISSFIMLADTGPILVNTFPNPYVPDVEEAAAGIVDIRISGLFAQHKAWFSCDAMGIDGSTPEHEIQAWYRRLARLFVELLDDNCLLIFIPDTASGFPINDDTEAALKADDPLTALQDTLTVPIIEVSPDDPLMIAAVKNAHAEWPKFVAAFDAKAGENFAVKAAVSGGGNTEFIWITVTALEGERIYGELANDPADLGPLKLGSKVSVTRADLNDWCYIDPNGNFTGGFTLKAIGQAAKRKRAE